MSQKKTAERLIVYVGQSTHHPTWLRRTNSESVCQCDLGTTSGHGTDTLVDPEITLPLLYPKAGM